MCNHIGWKVDILLDKIPRDKKYFTVVQWDDGVLNNLDGLDIKIFASGGVGDYPIPLICMPNEIIQKPRDIFASFIGVITGRGNGTRFTIQNDFGQLKGYKISEMTNFDDFKDTMSWSIFSLCPRGYGKTSFRICEALNLGSIPVYVYDEPWIPFNDILDFTTYGVLIHKPEIYKIDKTLKSFSNEQIEQLRETGKHVYKNYYTYEGCYDRIIEILANEYDW